MAGLTSRLADQDHDVTLITLGDGSDDKHRVDGNVHRIDLNLMRSSKNWASTARNIIGRIRAIRSAVRTVNPQVMLSFCDRTNVLAAMAADGSVPVVLSERSDPARQTLPRIWRMLRRVAFARPAFSSSGRIIVQTPQAAQFFAKSPVPCVVIPSAVDPPPLESVRFQGGNTRQVIAVGRLSPEKGFRRLLEAFAVVHQCHPDWSLRILGEGPDRISLEENALRLGIQSAVSMPGWISPVWQELASSSIFVLPSDYEGFPSALLEAMALGVPSIGLRSQVGSAAIIQSGINGLLTPSDPNSLAESIQSLIDNPGRRDRFSKAGQNVIDRFSWESMVEKYVEVLRSVANSPDTLD
jgi:glycosyltransferase involved in cell wall biosynthesis